MTNDRHPLRFLLALIALSCTAFAQQPPPDLDAYVARTMSTFEVPGLALAIVKDGQVVVAKGYGVRKLGEAAPVDAQTLFGIASNTKVFTAVALGLLVEEGKLEWDAPVVRYLPWFQMLGPIRHSRADHSRPAGASQRAGPGRRRPAVVATLDLRSPRDRAPPALHSSGDEFS
jgi:CubicO group peptidase (beta-lactamase class C family)